MLRQLALATVLLGLLGGVAHAATSAEGQLADRYAPILFFQPQARECDSGEPYRPTSVDIVLGRPDVVLRGPSGKVVKQAPTSADLFGLGEGYHVDFPGDPLRPGCTYERDFRKWSAGRRPSIYAHVTTDPAHRGKLAVEYWFFYTFNDSTGKHEGDWEMAQVYFDAPTPEAALQTHPYGLAVAQHAGGERSDWSDRKVEKEGTHPLLYVATGSHATYFSQRLFLGRGPHEGFGCDDTRKSSLRVEPSVDLLPHVPDNAQDPHSWLAFLGRWGQRERGFNNGVTGPAAKDSWSQPIEWSEGLRDGSVPVPGSTTLGPGATDFFCGAVSQTGVVINWAMLHPLPFYVLAGLVLAGSGGALRRTVWRPVLPEPPRRRRRAGQILRSASRIYRSDWHTFIAMGAIFVPLSLIAAAVQWVLFHVTSIKDFVALDGRHGAVTILFALLIGDVAALIASVCTTAAVATSLGELDRGRRITALEAFAAARARWKPLAGSAALVLVTMALLTLTVVGIPIAIWLFIRWSLFTQVCMLEGKAARDCLRRSRQLTRGYWWRTFGITAFINVLAALSGPVLGVILLFATDRSLNFIDITGSLVYALTVPYAALALTLYYFELTLAEEEARAPSRATAG